MDDTMNTQYFDFLDKHLFDSGDHISIVSFFLGLFTFIIYMFGIDENGGFFHYDRLQWSTFIIPYCGSFISLMAVMTLAMRYTNYRDLRRDGHIKYIKRCLNPLLNVGLLLYFFGINLAYIWTNSKIIYHKFVLYIYESFNFRIDGDK